MTCATCGRRFKGRKGGDFRGTWTHVTVLVATVVEVRMETEAAVVVVASSTSSSSAVGVAIAAATQAHNTTLFKVYLAVCGSLHSQE